MSEVTQPGEGSADDELDLDDALLPDDDEEENEPPPDDASAIAEDPEPGEETDQ